jgi:hypothetical protein
MVRAAREAAAVNAAPAPVKLSDFLSAPAPEKPAPAAVVSPAKPAKRDSVSSRAAHHHDHHGTHTAGWCLLRRCAVLRCAGGLTVTLLAVQPLQLARLLLSLPPLHPHPLSSTCGTRSRAVAATGIRSLARQQVCALSLLQGFRSMRVEVCCAVLCCAVLCCAVLCCAVLCCAVPCRAVLCVWQFLL